MNAGYRLSVKRERDRDYQRRKAKQAQFEASHLHLDFDAAEAQERTPSYLSDRGAGAEAIVAHCDGGGASGASRARRCVKAARERLRRAHPEFLEVFDLIMKNGTNRKESIWRMSLKRPGNGTPRRSATGTR